MDSFHKPVLLAEASQHLRPRKNGIVIDCTLGGAGHALEFVNLIGSNGTLLGLDADKEALIAAKKVLAPFSQQIILVNANFSELARVAKECNIDRADGIFFDLGVSSHQLMSPERGFSFQQDGPLDMRMGDGARETAREIVNRRSLDELRRIFKEFGEERFAGKIARAIVAGRERKEIETTLELAGLVEMAVPRNPKTRIHPATRVFQALRIEVNKELENLISALEQAVGLLVPGGRLVVIAYHSLEDRIVKRAFLKHSQKCVCPPGLPKCACGQVPDLKVITKKAVKPQEEEILANPRARSARLRAAEKL